MFVSPPTSLPLSAFCSCSRVILALVLWLQCLQRGVYLSWRRVCNAEALLVSFFGAVVEHCGCNLSVASLYSSPILRAVFFPPLLLTASHMYLSDTTMHYSYQVVRRLYSDVHRLVIFKTQEKTWRLDFAARDFLRCFVVIWISLSDLESLLLEVKIHTKNT